MVAGRLWHRRHISFKKTVAGHLKKRMRQMAEIMREGGNEMKKVLIATHGKMASGMSRTIQLLVGNMAEITTIDAYVEPDDDIETQMSQFFEQAGEEKIFVFTDIQGGSVNQKLLKYSERKMWY